MEEEAAVDEVICFFCSNLTSVKSALFFVLKIEEARSSQMSVVDVNGTYLHAKQQKLIQAGMRVTFGPKCSPSPLTGWEFVTSGNVQNIAQRCSMHHYCSYCIMLHSLPACMILEYDIYTGTLYILIPCPWGGMLALNPTEPSDH